MKLTDKDLMPFGKYQGRTMEKVPAGYLLWMADQSWSIQWPDVKAYTESCRKVLEKQAEKEHVNFMRDYCDNEQSVEY
jgi:hypothetical protein